MGPFRSAAAWLQNQIGKVLLDLFLAFLGVLLIGVGVSHGLDARPIPHGVLTTGRIVEIKEVTYRDEPSDRFPVVEFTGPHERTHRLVIEFTGYGRVGDEVPIRYDPEDPSRAQWVDHPGSWLWKAAVGLGVVLWLGLVGLWGWRWRVNRRE